MFLIRNIQQRIGSALSAAIMAVFVFICGALMTFVLGPQQGGEARRIEGMPVLDSAGYASAETGDPVLVTGRLTGNQALTDQGYVAYVIDEWDVSPPSNDNDDPDGRWTEVDRQIPALKVELPDGDTLTVAPMNSSSVGGAMQETLAETNTGLSDEYNGRSLHDGSRRTRGYVDGQTLTVVGTKGALGDLAPDRLYGGEKAQLVEEIRSGARLLFILGTVCMIGAPIIFVLGVLGALFGRRRAGAAAALGGAAAAAPFLGGLGKGDKSGLDFGGKDIPKFGGGGAKDK